MARVQPVLPGVANRARPVIGLDKDGNPPKECLLFRYGINDTTKGKFLFDEKSAASVLSEYKTDGHDLHVDYEHGAFNPMASKAPAAGWFEPELRTDGLYAVNIRWTPEGERHLKDKEYRYYSPAFNAETLSTEEFLALSTDIKDEIDDGAKIERVMKLHNFALTNLPATKKQEALVAANKTQLTDDEVKPMKTVLHALGLKDNADEAQTLLAVQKLNEFQKEVCELTGKATLAEAHGVLNALKQTAAEVNTLKAQIAKQEADARVREFDAVIESATQDGKIPPASEDKRRLFALSLRDKVDGLATLKSFVGALEPVVLSTTASPAGGEPSASVATVMLSDDEKRMAHKLGVSHKELLANKERRLNIVASDDDDEDEEEVKQKASAKK